MFKKPWKKQIYHIDNTTVSLAYCILAFGDEEIYHLNLNWFLIPI